MNIKKLFAFMFASLLCFTLQSCGGGDDITDDSGSTTPTGDKTDKTDETDKTDDSDKKEESTTVTLSIDARPTNWVFDNTNYDPAVGLTLTIAPPDLSVYPSPSVSEDSEGDLMATFVNGTCRGCSGLIAEGNVFMPVVSSVTTDNADESKPVTIKFYSARLHHVFTAKSSLVLKNAMERYGTISNPLTLEWEK